MATRTPPQQHPDSAAAAAGADPPSPPEESNKKRQWALYLKLIWYLAVYNTIKAILESYDIVKPPEFSLTDASIASYNLTESRRLFLILILDFQARTPAGKQNALLYSPLEVSVRKGDHHPLANDIVTVPAGFDRQNDDDSSSSSSTTTHGGGLIRFEAVAIYKRVERKIAAELKEDAALGAGFVNVRVSGRVRKEDGGLVFLPETSKALDVECNKVLVEFAKSTAATKKKFRKVDCDVHVESLTVCYWLIQVVALLLALVVIAGVEICLIMLSVICEVRRGEPPVPVRMIIN